MVTASKRFTIHRSANVLTLALKRFANFSGGKITKVPRHIPTRIKLFKQLFCTRFILTSCFFALQDVKYPEYLDLCPFMSQSQGEPQVYGLYAVLVHSGFSCHAGHYFCYIKVLLNTVTKYTFVFDFILKFRHILQFFCDQNLCV